ncbi:MAG TPA: M56 family metallopeptidase [Bradyrhizobium sp.]|nr:M56 family metallopeptidase [Bradyrhizobium sp.]
MLAIVAESALRSLLLGGAVWIGLHLLRVRNPHVQMTSWVLVLLASLSMPLLMHWTTVTIALHPSPVPVSAPDNLWPAQTSLPELSQESLPSDLGASGAVGAEHVASVSWRAVATAVYAAVTAMLLLRLAIGIHLTWRLISAAKPVREAWAANADVRVSDVIGGPVTFGSTILLPPQCIDWDLAKRRAVLAHEGAHIANGDFYVLLLASLNRAVFWFSPFAWWHLIRLAELAEIISDARAIEVVEDRVSYAEILLDLMQHVRQAPAGLDMARGCTVYTRVERILGAAALPAKLGWRKRIWTAAVIVPVVIVSAGSIAYSVAPESTLGIGSAGEAMTAARKPQLVDFYSAGPTSIFAVFREGNDLFGQLTWQRKLRLSVEQDGAYSYPAAAGQITFVANERLPELTLRQNSRDIRAARIAQISGPGIAVDASLLDSYVGWYELSPSRVLTVTRDGDRMRVQETGRSKFEVAAHGADAFSGNHDDLVIFLRDDHAKVTKVLFHHPMSGARIAPRVTVAKAKMIEDEFARRISEVPERFRDQVPAPGSKDAVLRGIEDIQRGAPNYDRMSAALAANVRRQASQLQAMLKALGPVESIFFRGVGPGGYDIYGVKFANGSAEFRLLLATDGKVDDVLFRPDGNDALGGIAACSEEGGLKSHGETPPIKLFFYNDSRSDIRLYKLDAEGHRTAHGTVGSYMSSSVLTSVDSPWVVADNSGQCLEIVLPGQRTRYMTVQSSPAGSQPEPGLARRSAPIAGSEEMLRQYIEGLGRGEPNYDRMTPEVAAQTRAQLPMEQAIVAKLGALRAVSFRGATPSGNDIYMAHFANGTAEWRIGLVKDGMIGRIALGPN